MIHSQRRRGSKGAQFVLAEAPAWHPWPGRTMNHPIFWTDSHFLTLHPPTGTGSTQLLHPLKKKKGKKSRRTKELGPHEQERAGGPSWAWLRPRLAASRVLEGSPGVGRSPRGPVAGWASRQRCLRLCRSAWDCGGLTAWPSAPPTTAQPSGLCRKPRAGLGQQWTLDSRPHALMFLPPRPRLRTWSYFCADRSSL